MKPNIDACISVARDIVIELYQRGYGTEDQLQGMLECAESVVAQRIAIYERETLDRAHYAYVEAVKRCGD